MVDSYKYMLKDYDDTYAISFFILKFIGIRIMGADSQRLCWTVFFWFEFGNMLLSLCLMSIGILEMAKGSSIDDPQQITTLITVGYFILAAVRSGKMMCNRSVFENIVLELRGLWPLDSLLEEDYVIVKSGLARLHRVVNGYFFSTIVALVSFLVPLFMLAVRWALSYDVELTLPFIYWFPFDPFQPYVFPLIEIVQIWHGIISGLFMIAGDFLFIIFVNHISLQFEVLAARVRRVSPVPVDRQMIIGYPLSVYRQAFQTRESFEAENVQDLGDKNWNQHQLELTEIIIKHRTLIRLAGDVEDMFSFSFLVNFFISTIIICFCGLCCVLVEKWNDFTYKGYLINNLAQTWLLCWHGQRLMDSSMGMSDAIYNSGWYRTNTKISKSIFIMLHRSQKQLSVTTYGFSTVSLETFATIVKSSWSYFTILYNFYSK